VGLPRAGRAIHGRTAGTRQFLDIGTGIPAANNVHQVAQSIAPQCRVVYVDNDAVVLSHARALLKSRPEGATAYIDADLRDPGKILTQAAHTLDFDRPIAIMLIGIPQFMGPLPEPGGGFLALVSEGR
jgi:S-adenosyl methyltransferase